MSACAAERMCLACKPIKEEYMDNVFSSFATLDSWISNAVTRVGAIFFGHLLSHKQKYMLF